MKAPNSIPSSAAPGHPSPAGVWIRFAMVAAMYAFLSSTYLSIAINSISLGLMAICFAGIMVSERRFLVRPTPLDYFFLAYVVAELLSMIFSPGTGHSLQPIKWILLIGIIYFFATWITTDQAAKRAVAVLLASAAIVACVETGRFTINPPDGIVRFGLFQSYGTISELMLIALLLLLPFGVHPDTPRRIRAVVIIALIPIGISLYATASVGASLAVAAGTVLVVLMCNRKLLVPLGVLAVLLVVLALPSVERNFGNLLDPDRPEIVSRLMLWKSGLRLFADHPVVGTGHVSVDEDYLRSMPPGDPAQSADMHNTAMQVLVTLGVVGSAAVVAMFFRIVQTEWRIWKRVRADWFRGSVALGALAVFVGLQVAGLTEWSFGDQEIVTLFWVTLGLALAVGELPPMKVTVNESPVTSGEKEGS